PLPASGRWASSSATTSPTNPKPAEAATNTTGPTSSTSSAPRRPQQRRGTNRCTPFKGAARCRRRDRDPRRPGADGPAPSQRRPPLVAVPPGKIEPGEPPEQATVRETAEETGLTAAATKALGEHFHPQTAQQISYTACEIIN
ncbi:NUDIX hydrolase, partial [Bradyrhizobium sp. BRP05]|nr:NUDIX hydrolase [Bradyrhizobium sp. BRP05]